MLVDEKTHEATDLESAISSSMSTLWWLYSGRRPSDCHTEVSDDEVHCALVDAVADFNLAMAKPQMHDTVAGRGKLTESSYRGEARRLVARLTRRPVIHMVSSHDRDTDVATEVFRLGASTGSASNGEPRRSQRGTEARSRRHQPRTGTTPARRGTGDGAVEWARRYHGAIRGLGEANGALGPTPRARAPRARARVMGHRDRGRPSAPT